MRSGTFFFSVISLIFTLSLMLVGICMMALPWAPHFRHNLANIIQSASLGLFMIGLFLFILSVVLLLAVYALNQRQYYRVTMGENSFTVDEALIERYVADYWAQLFPNAEIQSEVSIKKNQIEIIADLPAIPFSEQRDLLERIERELSEIFSKAMGYQTKFLLTVSFQEAS